MFPAVATFVYSILLDDASWVYVLLQVFQIGFPILWVVFMQRRTLQITKPNTRGLWVSLLFAFLVSAATLALYLAWLKPTGFFEEPVGKITEKVQQLGLGSPAKFIAFGVFVVLLHSFMEEYYWRWFVFGNLRDFVSLRTAIVLSSLAFMSFHVIHLVEFFGWRSPAVWLFAPAVAIGGAVWAWIYHRSKTLYGPWISHLLIDIVIYVIGYDLIRKYLV